MRVFFLLTLRVTTLGRILRRAIFGQVVDRRGRSTVINGRFEGATRRHLRYLRLTVRLGSRDLRRLYRVLLLAFARRGQLRRFRGLHGLAGELRLSYHRRHAERLATLFRLTVIMRGVYRVPLAMVIRRVDNYRASHDVRTRVGFSFGTG